MNTQGRPRPTQKGFQRENDKSQSAAASQLANMRGKGKSINELSPECNRISNGPNIYVRLRYPCRLSRNISNHHSFLFL